MSHMKCENLYSQIKYKKRNTLECHLAQFWWHFKVQTLTTELQEKELEFQEKNISDCRYNHKSPNYNDFDLRLLPQHCQSRPWGSGSKINMLQEFTSWKQIFLNASNCKMEMLQKSELVFWPLPWAQRLMIKVKEVMYDPYIWGRYTANFVEIHAVV